MREVLKKSIVLLFVLFIPLIATTASAEFVNSSLGYMRHYSEAIHMFLLGIGMFVIASYLRAQVK